jgi:hypothetical protein
MAAGAEVVLGSLLEFPPWYAAARGGVAGWPARPTRAR